MGVGVVVGLRFFLGFDPMPTQRVPPLYYFEISILADGP